MSTHHEVRPDGQPYARSSTLPRPTTTGWGLIVAWALAVLWSRSTVVAVGFLIGLTVLMAIDYLLGVSVIEARPVNIRPVRRDATDPGSTLVVSVEAPAGGDAIEVLIRRLSILADDAEPVVLLPDETEVELELPSERPNAAVHVRYRVASTMLGLVWASRWVVQGVPPLSIALMSRSTDPLALPVANEITKLREYLPGDRMSRVSWSTTARTGQLYVRDESTGDDEVVVVIDGGTVEQVISIVEGDFAVHHLLRIAAHLIEQLMAEGRSVRLVSSEIRLRYEQDERDLALANPRRWAPSPDPHKPASDGRPSLHTVAEVVIDRTDLIRRLALAEGVTPDYHPEGAFLIVDYQGIRAIT